MKESGVQIGVGSTTFVDGAKVSVNKVIEPEVPPASDTAKHEAEHAVTARKRGTGVRLVTVISGPGYEGLTQLDRFDPVAAAAPHGKGRKGTGWDIFVVQAMGHNVNAVAHAGKSIVDENPHLIKAVAEKLDSQGTLTGFDVDDAMQEAERKRHQQEVQIVFELPNGTRQIIEKQKAEKGVVVFERKWILDAEAQPNKLKNESEFDLAA